ncbi:uncharacterized protein si:dkey-171c9.3 [Anoplopoma fimbria]|uniref:uncharacterized protein si:dkey-171c9.3 n=1 Tax=Anoplopoma fimbria TaxID=229290 RepID=UPI0023ED3641|nr:uncharacterized protein si:dkey-171c9.3 [Anoplopoma fimbria]
MQTVSADQKVEEPTPEGLKRSHLNIGVLEEFAKNMSENIIQSFKSQMETMEPGVDCRASRFNQNQEMLAEELASIVVEVALREVCGGHNIGDHLEGSQRSAGVKMDGGAAKNWQFMDESDSERSTEMNPRKEIQTSKDHHHCHQSFSQPGLPVAGSLDYPDAPPTTPLLPELERSRHSFARKLKGGLAKVYPPSTPPPTPKDDSDGSAGDPQVELMEHLMHSLSTGDLERDYFGVGSRCGAKMEVFAEALSCDIIDWVLRDKNRDEDGDLHLLAHQLAETILTSSIDEAKMLV